MGVLFLSLFLSSENVFAFRLQITHKAEISIEQLSSEHFCRQKSFANENKKGESFSPLQI